MVSWAQIVCRPLVKKVLKKPVVSQECVGFVCLPISIRNFQLWLFLESIYSNKNSSKFWMSLSNTRLFVGVYKIDFESIWWHRSVGLGHHLSSRQWKHICVAVPFEWSLLGRNHRGLEEWEVCRNVQNKCCFSFCWLCRDEGFKYRSQRKYFYFFVRQLRLLQDVENVWGKKVYINLFEIGARTELREQKPSKRIAKCWKSGISLQRIACRLRVSFQVQRQ